MLKKLLIIIMMTLSSMHLLNVQANTNVLSQLPEAIQQRLHERLNNQEDDAITETKLTASDGSSYDLFGYSVAIDGNTLVVGVYLDDDNGTNSGSVYVYDLTQDINDEGFERKINASDGAASDEFGRSVAIDGNTLVVGAYGDDDNGSTSGSVYVYDLTLDGKAAINNTPATPYASGFERKITASDGAQNDNFGISVAIDGTTLVVGAWADDVNGTDSGSVYVYDLTKTSGDDGFETKITASDGSSYDLFGYSVSIDGTTLVVGAYQDDDNGSNSGSVYVYDLTNTSGEDGFETKITASDGAASDQFGYSVSIDGTTIVVGAQYDDDNVRDSGSVYVYDLTLDGKAAINNTPATPYASGFERKITASEGGGSDYFGYSVSIDGTTLVVGSHYDEDKGRDSGSAYVYDLTLDGKAAINNTPATPYASEFERKITASDGAEYDYFGLSVAIDGTTLVVGAWGADDSGNESGSVYIYNGTFGSGTTKTDEEWASEITTMIDALSEPYVRGDVEAARTAYDALMPEQQALVTNYQTLLDAEQALADIDAAAAVDAMIDALTDPYDIDAIDAARDAYENLTEAQKALVTGLTDLEEAEQRYADIDAASIVDGMIAALSEPYDAVAVSDARLAYDALTEIQKGYVTRLPELEAAEQALADINAAAAVDALIDALTSPYVRADVEAARDAYNNLTETQQALVTNYQDLLNAEQVLSDIDAAAAVDALIDALTSPYLRADVEAARDAYDALTETQQALVTGLLDLENAEAAVEERVNKEEATRIDALILTLTEDSTEEEIEAAREAYESLTEEQQALVTELPTLETYEEQVAPQDATGIIFFMLIFIGVISAVIYFGFYKRDREEKKNKYE